MNKTIGLTAFSAVVLSTLAVWLIASGIEEKPILPRGVPRETTKEQLDEMIAQWTDEVRPAPRDGCTVDVAETVFDFGTVDPGIPVRHSFALRNVGTSGLMLGDPRADDEGVAAAFSQREIAPGDEAQLVVRCVPFIESGGYATSVELPTSDPQRPTIRFTLSANVQRRLEAVPRSINFPDLDPHDRPHPQQTLIFSKLWDSFEITDSSCDLESLSWSIEPASSEQLAKHGAKSGYRIEALLPSDLPSGLHRALLKLKIQPPGDSEPPIDTQLHICGKVLRRLCIYGDQIDQDGLIDLGQIRRGTERRVVLFVKVRDPQLPELPEPRIEVQPRFVDVQLLPYKDGKGSPGCYRLEIVVPDVAPNCSHLRPEDFGEIRIVSSHPRIQEQILQLRFAVASRNDADF